MSEAIRVKGKADLPLTPDPTVKVWRVRRVYQFANGDMVGLIGFEVGSDCTGAIEHCFSQADAYCFLRGEEFSPDRMISRPFRCPDDVHRKIRRDWRDYERMFREPT